MVSDRYRFVLYSLIAGVSCDLLIRSLFWFSKRFHRNVSAKIAPTPYTFKAIFFPDSQVSCRNHFTLRHGCTSQRCRFSHDPENAYAQLLKLVISVFVLSQFLFPEAYHSILVLKYVRLGYEIIEIFE